jgi:hypothetical protein
MSWAKSGAKSETRELTPDEVKESDNDWRINLLLHMEIETYFLFSNILLDKIAHCIEDFFGPVKSTTFRSHDKCCKNIENYSQSLSLELPERFLQTALNLRDIATEFRDKQITHLRHPRAMHATIYHPEDGVQIVVNAIYPKPNDKQVNSPGITKISQAMNEYIELFIELIQGNRDKCRYNVPVG